MEAGEGVAATKPVETAKKGKVKVSVRDQCTGKRIADATVVVNGKSKKSIEDEDVIFDNQSIGAANIKVSKHFKEADYKTFITHQPRITRSWEAKSSVKDIEIVEEDKETKVRIELPMYRVVETVLFSRAHLKFFPLRYGHWWIEIGDKSYGWWPQPGELEQKDLEEPHPPAPLPAGASTPDKIGHMAQNATYQAKAARYAANRSELGYYTQAIGKTLAGVPGILNGDEDHKKNEKDPHHGDKDLGKTDEDYHPVIVDCRTDAEIHKAIRDFAFAYSGQWSWRLEFGKNCHTFQKDAMKKLRLDKVKEI